MTTVCLLLSCYNVTNQFAVCPRPLRHVLVSPTLVKYGINIVGDISKIQRYMNINPSACVDLSSLAKTVDKEPWFLFDPRSHFHTGISLSNLSQAYIGFSVYKPETAGELNPSASE